MQSKEFDANFKSLKTVIDNIELVICRGLIKYLAFKITAPNTQCGVAFVPWVYPVGTSTNLGAR